MHPAHEQIESTTPSSAREVPHERDQSASARRPLSVAPVDAADDFRGLNEATPRSGHGTPPATAVDDTAQSWLEAQCAMIAGVSRGVVLGRTTAEPALRPIARWPKDCDEAPTALIEAARQALEERTVVMRAQSEDGVSGASASVIASPLLIQADALGVAALEVPGSTRRQHQAIVQLLQWGATWYQLLRREHRSTTPQDRLVTVVELLAGSLAHPSFQGAATAAVTELAARLSCARVSLGLLRGKHIGVCAISHSARIDTRSNLVRDIGAAMDEAVDQDATVAHPPLPDGPPVVAFAQEVLARHGNGASVCSTPLYCGARAVGALTLERDFESGFDQSTVETCETLGALLGPIVELKHDKDRWVVFKVWDSLRGFGARLLGRGHFALKLTALALAASVAFLTVATGDYRITAPVKLEGSVKRVITAPRDGYVASAEIRAGDTVEAGQVLATLDDRELRLEQLQWRSQQEQLQKEHRAAFTGHDRSKAAILRAQMKQTSAQLDLIDQQLARTRLTAPFSGVVVSGDLSQALGSPVEHGQILFEVAPLDSYRVILEVDERDIGDVAAAQRGELTLTGLPAVTLPFTVTRIVSVSTPRDGRNFFEVEAELEGAATSIRPGMEGIGKIHVDRRKLAWIWTHPLIDWLRLSLWTWVS